MSSGDWKPGSPQAAAAKEWSCRRNGVRYRLLGLEAQLRSVGDVLTDAEKATALEAHNVLRNLNESFKENNPQSKREYMIRKGVL